MRGRALLVIAGLVWALFCVALAGGGHAPSRVFVPIPRHVYFAAQAAFVVPLLALQWKLCSWVVERTSRALGGRAEGTELADDLAQALAWPLLVCFLLPDVIAYELRGFAALGMLVRFTAPLTLLATLAAATHAVRRQHALSLPRAFLAGAAGVFAQLLAGSPLLR